MFGLVPKTIWSRMIPANEHNRIPQHANCLLLMLDDGRKGLIDAGAGPADEYPAKEREVHELSPGWPLAESLLRRDISPEQISFVILTHLHWDHAGGAVRRQSERVEAPAFARAEHFLHALEWEDATSGNPLFYKAYPPHIPQGLRLLPAGRLCLVDSDHREILPGVRLVRSGGHTRGHCAVVLDAPEILIETGGAPLHLAGRRLVFAGDVCPTHHHLRLVFQTAYDTFPLQTRAWKREWLPAMASARDVLGFCHDPELFGATLRADAHKEFVCAEKFACV